MCCWWKCHGPFWWNQGWRLGCEASHRLEMVPISPIGLVDFCWTAGVWLVYGFGVWYRAKSRWCFQPLQSVPFIIQTIHGIVSGIKKMVWSLTRWLIPFITALHRSKFTNVALQWVRSIPRIGPVHQLIVAKWRKLFLYVNEAHGDRINQLIWEKVWYFTIT